MSDQSTSSAGGSALATAAIGAGLSIAASALFTSNPPQSPISYPQNETTRGGYLPLVMGRRVVGCHVGWVGDRVSQAASSGGGSSLSIGPAPSAGNIYFEGGWHQLCHGPVSRLYRIWAGSQVIWSRMLDSSEVADGSMFQLPVRNGARIGDYFRIYFGRDPAVDDSYNPLNQYLYENTGLPSRWPGLCYVMWQRKNLGSAPQWPLMSYEIEI